MVVDQGSKTEKQKNKENYFEEIASFALLMTLSVSYVIKTYIKEEAISIKILLKSVIRI